MSYCINPNCCDRQRPDKEKYCQGCGTALLIRDRYRLVLPLRPLDKSPYIEVFEIDDRDDQGTRKVLKVLKTQHKKYAELFKQEARILTQLEHWGIPQAELEPNGYFTVSPNSCAWELHCVVMEKVTGLDLEQYLEEQQRLKWWQQLQWWQEHKQLIPQDLALNWMKQVVEILGFVHQNGFFHRDIKPSNIMQKPDGQLVLIDFGTARELTTTVIDGREVTIVYTHGYAAPEQIDGKAVPQSDFFALGRTFVHLLTGRRPDAFAKNPQTGKLTWRDSAPQISEQFADLIDDLMAVAVQDRPQTTQEISQRLKRLDQSKLPDENFHSQLYRSAVIFGFPTVLLAGVWIGILISKPSIERIFTSNPPPCDSPDATDVSDMEFSSDGNYLATASLDKTVRVIEAATNKQVSCQQHADGAVAVKFSPKGQYLATASLDSTARLWEMSSKGSISDFKTLQHNSPVVAIAFSPDGKYLATASADGTTKVWNTDNREEVAFLKHKTYVRAVSFSPDGRYLAIASLNHKAQVWDWQVHRFDQIATSLPPNDVVAIAFNPMDGKYLATASAKGVIQIWDTKSRQEVTRQPQSGVKTITFSPDGKHVAVTSFDNQAWVWNWSTRRYNKIPQDDVIAVAFSPKGKSLAAASTNDEALVWEATSISKIKAFSQGNNQLVAVAFSPVDEESLAIARVDGKIEVEKW